MISDSTQETKHKIDFQYPQGVYFLEPEERPHENKF